MTDINILTDRERAEMREQLSQLQVDPDVDGSEVQLPPATHTLLEVWSSILGDIETMRAEAISMASASQTLNSYPFLRLRHLSEFHERFYDHLLEYREVLEAEIATDPSCFKHVEDDAEKNREHYLNLLVAWQVLALRHQEAWDHADKDAAAEFAAISESTLFVVGDNGLIAHLGAIQFPMPAEDRDTVTQAILNAIEESRE